MRRFAAVLQIAVYLVMGVVGLAIPEVAEATHCPGGPTGTHIMYNQERWCGYFDNQYAQLGNDVYDGGLNNPFGLGVYVNNPTEFINIVGGGVTSGNAWYNNASRFIVLSMLGYNSGVSRSQIWATCSTGVSCLQEWRNRVTSMSSYGTSGGVSRGPNGSIRWNHNVVLDCGTRNTYFQNSNGVTNDVAPFIMTTTNGSCGPSYWQDTISFFNTSGSLVYMLRRVCANPIGDLPGLPVSNYDVQLTGDRNGNPYNVVAGGTYSVRAQIHNNGPSPSAPGDLQVMYPGASVSSPSGTGMTGLTSSYSSSRGYRGTSQIPGYSGANWFWEARSLPRNATTSGTLQFTVSPTVTVGTIITFRLLYYQGDENASVAPRRFDVTFRVVSTKFPGVEGLNSDIHAGGGVGDCTATPTTGYVRGNPDALSYGEYVVSANLANGINSFRSNGPATGGGTNNLKLGNAGAYAQVCRPDLWTAAQAYRTAGVGYSTTGATSFDVTNKQGVYFLDAATTNVFGTVTNKLTLVGRTIRITGPIAITGTTFAPHDAPSLGIIASGDIVVNAAVTRVDAYMFSNGVIDTCVEGRSSTTACNTPVLLVNGFLMARDIDFHRLAPAVSSGTAVTRPIAERIVLNPQIYLNPPKLFDASVDDVLLEGQGERQPLF